MRTVRNRSERDYYHVMSRGVGRQLIFEDDEDRLLYLKKLAQSAKKHELTIIAWCLMDNHTHLLIESPIESIAASIRDVNSTYAQYFNKRHNRVGHLFQGRFKSTAIDSDSYLLQVLRYIHQNPEKGGLGSTIGYPWSSYREYAGNPLVPYRLCKTTEIMAHFESIDSFASFHMDFTQEHNLKEEADPKRLANTDEIRTFAESAIGKNALANLKTMDKKGRDCYLATLRQSGLSIRQIERLTGIGRNIIGRAK